MKFGLTLVGLRPRWYTDVARQVEAAGFESVWFGEHLVLPATLPSTYPYASDGNAPITPDSPLYDAFVMLAGIATATTTLRLGTNVYVLPLRHPLVTARSVVTLDRLSGGRVTLGAGVGWLKDEFDAAGVPFAERGSRMDEIIPLLRRLWSGQDPITHEGQHFSFGPVHFRPKSIQKPSIPIELGGTSPAALRRAALMGDGWMELGSSDVDEIAGRIAGLTKARSEAGLGDHPFEITASLAPEGGDLGALEQAGVTRVITHIPGLTAESTLDEARRWIDAFAAETIASSSQP
ncbi:LLM class F420-dependent oxidoreductase [Blastococcus sp. CT_GayMR16]|uniref:LLM class F420-dependent oxidoreductase n=1 Tax=Blastococcus sp. CT_GayMR16 TaxID=2559607 RepID=UPI0010739AF3|nr:LLM class F420-dependent oxidoreductase [Blastococcus sp. CT_GayMR16]TFV86416.1 LLM class F420-dependent oxidoreductase [Blastococcus sp. CT_GayMR16]